MRIIAILLVLIFTGTSYAEEDRYIKVFTTDDGAVYYVDKNTYQPDKASQMITFWNKLVLPSKSQMFTVYKDIKDAYSAKDSYAGTTHVMQKITTTCPAQTYTIHSMHFYKKYSSYLSITPEYVGTVVPGTILESIFTTLCDVMNKEEAK